MTVEADENESDKRQVRPGLGAQLLEHQPNPEWPHWGRDALDHGHAIFAIASHLRTLALSAWFERLSNWLARYDGFERYVDEGCDPFICVRDCLAKLVASLHRPAGQPEPATTPASGDGLLERVVDAILSQEFLRYVAYWGRGLLHEPGARVWNPLEQPWMEFVEAGREGEELLVWRAHYLPIQPTLAQHRAVLLAS